MFGSTQASTFGTPSTSSNVFGPGFFSSPATTNSVFGTNTNTFGAPNTFGAAATNTFGATANTFGATSNTFGANINPFGTNNFGTSNLNPLGGNTQSTGLFNQPTQNVGGLKNDQSLAVFEPSIYGDERDNIIGRFNQLMCAWGVGRGYHNKQGNYVDFKPDNPFAMFKAVGYSKITSSKNEDGLVTFTFQKSESEIHANHQIITEKILELFGNNRQNYSINVYSIRPLSSDKCDFTFFVQEKLGLGAGSTVSASNMLTFLQRNRPQFPPQIPLLDIFLHVTMTSDAMKTYLSTPPSGINPVIWEQAILDNPDLSRYLPVVINGFNDLATRVKQQEHEVQLQQKSIAMMNDWMKMLRMRVDEMSAKYDERIRKQMILAHRLLKVMVCLEVKRKSGLSLQVEEEALARQLDNIQHQLNMPSQFKGRLNELMSQFRMHNLKNLNRSAIGTYKIEEPAQVEVVQLLSNEQEALSVLKKIISDCSSDLSNIQKDMLLTFNISHMH